MEHQQLSFIVKALNFRTQEIRKLPNFCAENKSLFIFMHRLP